jgi:hypothetical protein
MQIQSDKKVIIERINQINIMPNQFDPMRNRPYMHMQHLQQQIPGAPLPTAVKPPENKSLPFKDVERYLIDAKYFMIKSANFNNIEKSVHLGEWATTQSNEVFQIYFLYTLRVN